MPVTYDPFKPVRDPYTPPTTPTLTVEQKAAKDVQTGNQLAMEAARAGMAAYNKSRALIYGNDDADGNAIDATKPTSAQIYAAMGPTAAAQAKVSAVLWKSVVNFLERMRAGDPDAKIITDDVPEATITLPQ
jgi:hypothetical protein